MASHRSTAGVDRGEIGPRQADRQSGMSGGGAGPALESVENHHRGEIRKRPRLKLVGQIAHRRRGVDDQGLERKLIELAVGEDRQMRPSRALSGPEPIAQASRNEGLRDSYQARARQAECRLEASLALHGVQVDLDPLVDVFGRNVRPRPHGQSEGLQSKDLDLARSSAEKKHEAARGARDDNRATIPPCSSNARRPLAPPGPSAAWPTRAGRSGCAQDFTPVLRKLPVDLIQLFLESMLTLILLRGKTGRRDFGQRSRTRRTARRRETRVLVHVRSSAARPGQDYRPGGRRHRE